MPTFSDDFLFHDTKSSAITISLGVAESDFQVWQLTYYPSWGPPYIEGRVGVCL